MTGRRTGREGAGAVLGALRRAMPASSITRLRTTTRDGGAGWAAGGLIEAGVAAGGAAMLGALVPVTWAICSAVWFVFRAFLRSISIS